MPGPLSPVVEDQKGALGCWLQFVTGIAAVWGMNEPVDDTSLLLCLFLSLSVMLHFKTEIYVFLKCTASYMEKGIHIHDTILIGLVL